MYIVHFFGLDNNYYKFAINVLWRGKYLSEI